MNLYDPLMEVTWKYLPVYEILRLCETNKKLHSLCKDPDTWKYLLERDYSIETDTKDPKSLYIYNTQYRPSKIFEVSIYDYEQKHIVKHYDMLHDLSFLRDSVKKDIVKDLLKKDLRRGDIIHIDEYGDYRNEGKLIYNGSILEDLADEPDDYGNVPSSYTIGDEFKALHWKDTIDHNSYVWIDLSKYRSQLLESVKDEEDASYFRAKLGTFFIYFAPEGKDTFIEEVTNKDLLLVSYSNYDTDLIEDRGEYDNVLYWFHE